jgi:hypothetical protein
LNTSDASILVRLWKKLVDDGYGADGKSLFVFAAVVTDDAAK